MKKTVLITGATAGIGKACAEIFAKNNFDLILTGRREERLVHIKNELEAKHACNVKTLCFDVRNNKKVEEALSTLVNSPIDVLINNAGLALGLSRIHEGELSDWETMIDTNIKGLLYVSRQVMPQMVKRSSGHIINIGSIAGKETYLNGNVYCATKHAVDSLSKAMRIDLLPYGIRVTAIHPGAVETEFSIVRYHGDEQRAKDVYNGFTPLNAEDIADAVFYAASRPVHVNINDMVIMPTAQANTSQIIKS
jgi:3-hydroxy acid dehydrogenase / malonic semialdehyde reductase